MNQQTDHANNMENCDFCFADVVLLVLSVAMSGYFEPLSHFADARSEARAELIAIIFLRGLAIWGPLILLSQFKIRGRNKGPGVGEMLWVIEAGLLASFWLVNVLLTNVGLTTFWTSTDLTTVSAGNRHPVGNLRDCSPV